MEKVINKRRIKLLIIFILISILLGSSFVVYYRYLSPSGLKRMVEHQLKERFQQDVNIQDVNLNTRGVPTLTLSGITGSSEKGHLVIDKIIIHFSIKELIFGSHQIFDVKLIHPDVSIILDKIKPLKKKKGGEKSPNISIENGFLRVFYKGNKLKFDNINAYKSNNSASVNAKLFGSDVKVNANHIKNTWDIKGEIKDLMVEDITPKVSGNLSALLNASISEKKKTATIAGNIENLIVVYPERSVLLDYLTINLDAKGDKDTIRVHNLTIESPALEIGGWLEIDGTEDLNKAKLSFDLSSNEFDYNQTVEYLPTEYIPKWLTSVLREKVRDGKSRFTSIRYQGGVKNLKNARDFAKNLYVVGEINSQSFGIGYNEKRIKDINGSIIFDGKDLKVHNLSGHMGDSFIERVDVYFLEKLKPGLRVKIGIDVDMDADEFISTWRACTAPKKVNHMLDPVSAIKGGKISGNAWVYWDKQSGEPPQFMGDVHLDRCSFNWNKHIWKYLSGDVRLTEMGYYGKASFQGTMNGTPLTLTEDLDIRTPRKIGGTLVVDGFKIDATGAGKKDTLKGIYGETSLVVRNVQIYGMVFERATAKAKFNDNILQLDNLQLASMGGSGKGVAVVNTEGSSTLDVMLSFRDANVKKMFPALLGGLWIDGTVDIQGRVWGSADSLKGDIGFFSKDGHIMKLSALSKIFATLNLYRIFTTKKLDIRGKGFSYNFITSTFKIRDNIVYFDDFYLDSNSIQMSAIGEYNLKTREIDSIVSVQPLEIIDKTINILPLPGKKTESDNEKTVVIDLKIKGNIDDPLVSVVSLTNISESIRETLRRSLRLPREIIEQGMPRPGTKK